MEHTQYMQSLGNFKKFSLSPDYIRYFFLCQNIPGRALSSAICLTTVPLILKKKFILYALGAGWEPQLARVFLRERCVAVCAFLVLSLSTFQRISLKGESALSVIVLKPTQPLMLSHASSQNSLSCLSHSSS